MKEHENTRTGLQRAVDLAYAARAARRIIQAAAAGGLHGAAAVAVKETAPFLVKRLLAVLVLYLCIAFLPFALSTKIMVTLVVIVPVGGFGLIGVNDDSMTRWLEDWWRWRRRRRIILFRGEVRK